MKSKQIPDSRDFEELAFIIPVRIDHEDRFWNLSNILRFIETRMKGAEIVIVERDTSSKLLTLLEKHPRVKHIFNEDDGPFRRAFSVNLGAQSTDRRFVCMYDADVLIDSEAIRKSIHALSKGWRLVLPYNRICVDLEGNTRRAVGETLDFDALGKIRSVSLPPPSTDVTFRFIEGGICIVNRETFLAEGGLNCKMLSYGWEDTEMFKRFQKLGYPSLHLPQYSMVHLNHARGIDSRPNDHYERNKAEFLKVVAMSRPALERYVENELSITALHDFGKIQTLREAQRQADFGGHLRLKAFLTLIKIHVQSRGFLALVRKAIPQ